MTYYVSGGTLNLTHSLTLLMTICTRRTRRNLLIGHKVRRYLLQLARV